MFNMAIKTEILEQLEKLAADQQQQVLNFIRILALNKPVGVAGKELLRFAGAIDSRDLRSMAQAIEDGCEQVNLNEW